MKTTGKHDGDMGVSPDVSVTPGARFPAAPVIVAVLLAAETIAVAGAFCWLLVQLVTTRASSLGGGVAIVVVAAIAVAWLAATTVAFLRHRPWTRGSAITWQVIQIAIAVGCFQGLYAEPWLGWLLLIPALVTGALMLTRPITAWLPSRG